MPAASPLDVENEIEAEEGLRVPDLLGPPRNILEGIRGRFEATQVKVDESLKALGLPTSLPEPSTPFPSGEVNSLQGQPEEAYGAAYDHNMAWVAFLTNHLTSIQSLKMAADTVVKLTAAQLRRQFTAENRKRGTKERYNQDELDNLVLTHESYIAALVVQQQHAQNKLRVEGLLGILNKNIAAISRHITLRGQEMFRLGFPGQPAPFPPGTRPNPLSYPSGNQHPRPERNPNAGMDIDD